jgi:hypothetical protein
MSQVHRWQDSDLNLGQLDKAHILSCHLATFQCHLWNPLFIIYTETDWDQSLTSLPPHPLFLFSFLFLRQDLAYVALVSLKFTT